MLKTSNFGCPCEVLTFGLTNGPSRGCGHGHMTC